MRSFFTRQSQPQGKTQSPILKWVGRFFTGLGVMVFISFIISSISLMALFSGQAEMQPLPPRFVVVDEFQGSRPDVNTVHPLIAELIPQPTTLYSFLQGLKAAKDDPRVTHFVAVIKDGDYSLPQIQSVRQAVIDFRSSGKKAIIYADNFGGFSNGIGEYWLATAFDEIWLNPMGLVSLMGIRIEQPFVKDALDQIGVTFEMEQRKAYKTGAEIYTRDQMSAENRETIQALIDNIMSVMMRDIVNAREMLEPALKDLIDESPLLADKAYAMGLVTHVGYLDELESTLKGDESADGDDMFVGMKRYAADVRATTSKIGAQAKIAMIHIDGMIVDGDVLAQSAHPLAFMMPDQIADPALIVPAIRDAAKNEHIDVIMLRVNSPGGTPEASEKIRRAVVKAREKGKYVMASFSDVAASGGYWIAVNADEIIADDLTVTGSIGVYGGKPDLSGLWDMIGVHWQAMQYGDNAGLWSTNKGLNEGERARLQAMMDHTYDAFVARVAEGRMMPIDEVEPVAQGRAWVGVDAIHVGLVDRLGGFETALQRAAERIEIDDWTQARVVVLPQDDDPFDDFVKLLGIPSIQNRPQMPLAVMPFMMDNAIVTAPVLAIDF